MKDFKEFKIDKSLISDIIKSQNGSLSKSIQELIMNGIDKGSKRIEVSIFHDKFIVTDYGTGFESAEYIEKFFVTFGTPHKSNDAKFGRFRVGRGQIMNYGKITWRSHEFQIDTNIKKFGIGYSLKVLEDDYIDGCTVTGVLYDHLTEYELLNTIYDLEKFVKYLSEEVVINAKSLGLGSNDTVWDYEDEYIKVKWRNGERSIRIYNQGIYVKSINNYRYAGLEGDIVTKKPLTLNMARNEVNDKDGLWTYISTFINNEADAKAKLELNKKKLSESSRIMLIRKVLLGQLDIREVSDYPIVKDFRGHSLSLCTLSSGVLPMAQLGSADRKDADIIAAQKTALILDDREIGIWKSNNINEMIDKIADFARKQGMVTLSNSLLMRPILDMSILAKGIDSSVTTFSSSQLSARLAAARDALTKGSKVAARELSQFTGHQVNVRKILIGKSNRYEAWTDGASYISFEKDILKTLERGMEGAVQSAMLMMHEYTHCSDNLETHLHNIEFYENFHDAVMSSKYMIAGKVSNAIFKEYSRSLIKRLEKLPKKCLQEVPASILRDIHDYSGKSCNSGKISDLSRIILDSFNATYSINKKRATVSFSASKFYTSINNAQPIKNLIREAKKDGFVPVEIDEINNSSSEVSRLKRMANKDCIQKWADKHGHDFSSLSDILFSNRLTIRKIIAAICLDENSDILYLEKEGYIYHVENINKNSSFKTYGFYSNFRLQSLANGEDLAKNKECVEDAFIFHMEKVLSSIQNPKIVDSIKEKFFTDELLLKLVRFS